MIAIVTLLLFLQLAGEVIVVALGIPLPGPVMGMVLLFLGLCIWDGMKRPLPESLDETVGVLLGNLSLLFVPAGVGVVLHLSLVRDEWLPIAVAVLGSTVLTVGVTALLMSWLLRIGNGPPPGGESRRHLDGRDDGTGVREGGSHDER